MRTIKIGTIPEVECTCSHCGTVFAYTRKDMTRQAGYPLIVCPVCGVEIEKPKWPQHTKTPEGESK